MDTATGPSSQARAIEPFVHTLSSGLEKIHPVAFTKMAYNGHRVHAVEIETDTKFMIKTECINDEPNSNRKHCKGTGTIQLVLGNKAPALYLAKLNHDDGCRFSSTTLEDSACSDETFLTNYCEYLTEAIRFSSIHVESRKNARKALLDLAEQKGYDVPCSDIASINAGKLAEQIGALSNKVIDYYSVPRTESFWKF